MNILDIVFWIVAFLWLCSFIVEIVCYVRDSKYLDTFVITSSVLVLIIDILAIINIFIKQ